MIPYSEIETLFLDAGNTLVSMDFPWIARELSERGVHCSPEQLRRAEAAARPGVSAGLAASSGPASGVWTFERYFEHVLSKLAEAGVALAPSATELALELTPVLQVPGQSSRLWSFLLPGVPEALAGFREAGLALAVVSNSDGTVERGLQEQGLHHYFDAIVDSYVVGFEKPDPRIFEHALARVAADPSRTLHVGDLYAADVAGARGAGLHALLLDPFDDWGEVDCPRLPDLSALLERLRTS